MSKPKIFIFGIDGGTWDLLDPLICCGQLPALAALKQEAAAASTSTTWPPHTAPGWASFVTASMPGAHGVYQFFDTQQKEYKGRIIGTHDYGRPTCWEWAASTGLTLGLVNIPMSHPALALPGYQITWPLKQTTSYCRPQQLLGELARAGLYFRSDLATMFRGSMDYIEHAPGFVRERMAVSRHLLRTSPVDVFAVVLTEADRVCHHYWQFSDKHHPLYTNEAPAGFEAAITTVLGEIDSELGKTLKLLPDDCAVVVVSDHGFGPGHRSLASNAVLRDGGLLRAGSGGAKSSLVASWFNENGWSIDWSRTRAYMPVPGSYAININVRGRQACGTVEQSGIDKVLDEVISVFRDIRIPETGAPAFSAFLRREEAYPGPMMPQAPDLLLIPADESLMVTPSLGERWTWSYQTGLHRHEGMWMHRSPRIKTGWLQQRVRLIDILPTVFADIGLDVPPFFDGQPIAAAFSSPSSPDRRGVRVVAGGEDDSESGDLTTRLKQMGYI